MLTRVEHIVLACLFSIVLAAPLLAQDLAPSSQPIPQMYFGVIGGVSLISNRTTLDVYPGSSVCGQFSNGDSQGLFAGLTYEYPFLPFLQASARLLYAIRPATLTMQTDNGLRAYDDASGTDVPYIRENVFDASLRYLSLDAGVRLEPFTAIGVEIPFYVRLSVDAGDPIFGASYTQTEEIIQPRSRLFPDGTLKHVINSGKLTDAGTSFGASGAVGYELQLNRNLFLDVEGGYRRGLNSVLSDQDWRVVSYYAAVNLRYAVVEDAPKPFEPAPTPALKSEPTPIAKKAPVPLVIEAFKTNPLEVQETIVTETYPLLPYLFYDSSASVLRERYTQSVDPKSFNEKKLVKSTLAIYYHVLDIVASRLLASPSATLVLTGTTDGRELGTASQRRILAEERANSVKSYLTRVWSIDESRLKISIQDLPQLESNPVYAEGLEENRRVEISSEDPSILAPVVHARFMEYQPVQSKQVFSVKALRPELAQNWDASLRKNANIARVSGANGLPAQIPFSVDSSVMVAIGRDIAASDSLEGRLDVLQKDGSTVSAECRFPIIKSQNQFELSRLSLIVFDFDRSDINATNKNMMQTFIREAMQPNSKVSITGSTDRLGEEQYNKNLSQSRADEVKRFLLTLQNDAQIQQCIGVGASRLPYDNALPEGRYYCRTVSIVIQTPISHP